MHDLWLLPKPAYIVSQFTRCLCFLIFHRQNWTTKIKSPGSLFSAVESFLLGLTFHPGRALRSLPIQGSGRAPSHCWPGGVWILLLCLGLVPRGTCPTGCQPYAGEGLFGARVLQQGGLSPYEPKLRQERSCNFSQSFLSLLLNPNCSQKALILWRYSCGQLLVHFFVSVFSQNV